jgi:hypothetical protein
MSVYVGIVESTALVSTRRPLLGMSGPCQAGSRAATFSTMGRMYDLGIAPFDSGTPR